MSPTAYFAQNNDSVHIGRPPVYDGSADISISFIPHADEMEALGVDFSHNELTFNPPLFDMNHPHFKMWNTYKDIYVLKQALIHEENSYHIRSSDYPHEMIINPIFIYSMLNIAFEFNNYMQIMICNMEYILPVIRRHTAPDNYIYSVFSNSERNLIESNINNYNLYFTEYKSYVFEQPEIYREYKRFLMLSIQLQNMLNKI